MRRLPLLDLTLLSLLAGPLAAGAESAVAATACGGETLPWSLPVEEPPPESIADLELALPAGAEPLDAWRSCVDFCVMVVQACIAACPGAPGEPQHDACRYSCYHDYETCVNGCWRDEVPEGP